MKKWIFCFIAVLGVWGLSACGGGESSSVENKADSDQVSLDFWVFGATNYEELAAEYEEENPGVSINVKVSENADHHDALFTALSAGSGAPDLAMLEVDQIDRFKQAEDRFANLYDQGADAIQDQYLDWKWKIGENAEGDFLFGLPTDIGPKGMYYNTEVFEEAGLPTEPEEVAGLISSKEDFLDVGREIKESTGKPMVDSMEMAYRAKMDGLEKSYFDEQGNLLLENEENQVKEAYDLAVEMNELGIVGNYTMWSPEWTNAVNDSDFAVEMGAAWLKGWMSDNAPDSAGKWRVVTLPEEFAGNWGGSYLGMPAETENKEEAYAFAEWLISPDNQLASFLSDAGLFPSTPETYEKEEFKVTTDEYFGGQSTAQVFAEAAEDIPAVYKGPEYVSVNDEILTALQNVQDGADPEEEWEAAVTRIKGLLER
ncbi:ABC transporter substrate-binding protein [Salibacterium aidingense]|uniref:ABC transporter substrate-binding protein n=1 Tax=Salibacterium aidingense TaxID=384933 RepID=UPI003BC6147D